MSVTMKTEQFYKSAADEAYREIILYVGVACVADTASFDVLKTLDPFKGSLKPDHSQNTRYNEDHGVLLDAIDSPDRLKKVLGRIAEDLPDAYKCLLFLPQLNANEASAQLLRPLTEALETLSPTGIRIVLPVLGDGADQPIVRFANAIEWPYPIDVTDHRDAPDLHAQCIADKIQSLVERDVFARLDACKLDYDIDAVSKAIIEDIDKLQKRGLTFTQNAIPALAKCSAALFYSEVGLETDK